MPNGMVKLFSPGDWVNGDQPDHQIKIASSGLGAGDKLAAMKFASEEMLHWLSNLDTSPDCVYVHKVAMSGSDRFGPNRWGDGFRDDVLSRDVPTFEQYARAFRHHKSAKAPFYGRPKLARFRSRHGTVELITEYYGTDKVASLHGGKVADLEINSLVKLGHIPVSMGSHVPFDVCVICGHKAPTRAQHCRPKAAGGTCELFGCKDGILKIAADGRQQYVDNPFNCFFDISYVSQGADPVANGLALPLGLFGKDGDRLKVAEYSSKLAEYVPSNITEATASLCPTRRAAMQLAYVWADLETKLASEPADEIAAGLASTSDPSDVRWLHANSESMRSAAIAKYAAAKVCPSFAAFASAAGYTPSQVKYASQFVPNLYTRFIRHQLLPAVVQNINLQKFASDNFVEVNGSGNDTSIERGNVLRRGLRCNAENVTPVHVKAASFEAPLPAIAVEYGAFKLAWACRAELDMWTVHALAKREFFTIED